MSYSIFKNNKAVGVQGGGAVDLYIESSLESDSCHFVGNTDCSIWGSYHGSSAITCTMTLEAFLGRIQLQQAGVACSSYNSTAHTLTLEAHLKTTLLLMLILEVEQFRSQNMAS